MKIATNASLVVRLGIAATAALLSQQALAVGTDAGVTVSNQASVAYDVGAVTQTPIDSSPTGNSVPGAGAPTEFLVDRRVDFSFTDDGATAVVTPGDTGLTFDFNLVNEANGPLDFTVTVTQLASTDPAVNGLSDTDVDVSNVTFSAYVDNLAEDANTTVTITGDAGLALVNGDVANFSVEVVAVDPAGDSGNIIALVDGAGSADTPGVVDNVFADPGNDNSETGFDGIQVVSAALAVQKTSAVISDPFVGVDPNAKAVPDAVIEYTITIDNSGGASDAVNVVVSDNIQVPDVLFETAAYGAGQNVSINGAFCDADDAVDTNGDGCSFDPVSGALSVDIGTVAATTITTITFQVRVNPANP